METDPNNEAPTMPTAPQPDASPRAAGASQLRLKITSKRKPDCEQAELEPTKKKSRVSPQPAHQSIHRAVQPSITASDADQEQQQGRDCKALYRKLKERFDSFAPELESFKRHIDACEKTNIVEAKQAQQVEEKDEPLQPSAAVTATGSREEGSSDESIKLRLKSKLKRRNEQCSAAIARAKKAFEQISELRVENDNLRRVVEERDTENDDLAQEVEDLKQKINDMGNSYADRDLFYTKVTDEEITGPWNNMMFLIRQLVLNYLQNPPVVEECMVPGKNEYTEGVLRLSHETKTLSAPFRVCRFQGYIWRRIEKDIFQGLKVDWAEPVVGALLPLIRELTNVAWSKTPSAELMSAIKSETAYRVDSHFPTDEAAFERYIDSVVSDLSVFVTHDDGEMSFRARMSQIIREAEKLRKIMMKSKAFFRTGYPIYKGRTPASIQVPGGVHVDHLETTDEHDEPTILHVITPELWKCGVAMGWSFEHKTLLCNAVVVVSRSKEEEQRLLEEEAHLATPERTIADKQHEVPDVSDGQAEEQGFEKWLRDDQPSDDTGEDDGSNYSDN